MTSGIVDYQENDSNTYTIYNTKLLVMSNPYLRSAITVT